MCELPSFILLFSLISGLAATSHGQVLLLLLNLALHPPDVTERLAGTRLDLATITITIDEIGNR